MPLLEFIAAAALCLAVHLGVMALLAHACGISVRRVAYGIGPTVFSNTLLHVKAFPLSGQVRLKDSREEPLEPNDRSDAFNFQPVWKQVFLPLAGSGSLVATAVLVLGSEGWTSFLTGFEQTFRGALSPFGAAQLYLQSFSTYTREHSFVAVAGLVASKLAAINLLPFGALNGGQALMNLVRFGRPELKLEDALTRWGILFTLLLFIAWMLALGNFVLEHAS